MKDQWLKLQSVIHSVNLQDSFQPSTPAPSSLGYDVYQHALAFQNDDMDFADLIWSQQEINRLSNEVLRLEADVSHWRHFAQTSTACGADSFNLKEIYIHQVGDAIQPSHPLSSPSPPAPNPPQHESFPVSQLFA